LVIIKHSKYGSILKTPIIFLIRDNIQLLTDSHVRHHNQTISIV
jgi:hypothetical protein